MHSECHKIAHFLFLLIAVIKAFVRVGEKKSFWKCMRANLLLRILSIPALWSAG